MIVVILFCILLGIVAGLRSMLPLAAVSWAARLGLLNLSTGPFAFFGYMYAPYICTVLAIGELIGDKLPKTPSRKAPFPFIGRILTGALVGAALGSASHYLWIGLIAGIVGAVIGTVGGAAARTRLAQAFGKDLPAALIEDVVAILLAIFVVTKFQ